MAKLKPCPICGQNVSLEKLGIHLKKVHPREKVEVKLEKEERTEVEEAAKARRRSARPKGRWIVLVALLVIVAVVIAFVYVPRGIKVGDMAPGFNLPDTYGVDWNLDSHLAEKKPILLEFMHPWCVYCNNSVATLRDVFNHYGTQLTMVSIAVRNDAEAKPIPTLEMLNQHIQDWGVQWPCLLESPGTDVRDRYGVSGTPTCFLLDTDGKISYIHVGELDFNALKSEIDRLTP
jgi:peroxiredoxin